VQEVVDPLIGRALHPGPVIRLDGICRRRWLRGRGRRPGHIPSMCCGHCWGRRFRCLTQFPEPVAR